MVVDGKITEVEINFDDGPQVNAKNLIPYDPLFNTIVPEGERSSREQLERIINSHFQGLTDHQPIEAGYDPRCDRYPVETGSRATLETVLRTAGMWAATRATLVRSRGGPATETRIAVVDPERGIVVGYSIQFYGASPRRMQINEVFKILDGRISDG